MKTQLRTLDTYKPGKQIEEVKREYGLTEITKLASNENPFGTSPAVSKAIEAAFGELNIYPDGYAFELRAAVERHLGVTPGELLFGNGTDEIIHMISRSFLEPGTNTVMATPTFPQYKRNAIIDGAEVREIPLTEGRHDLTAMASSIDGDTRVVWLCNPNNPTGEYIREDELKTFMKQIPEDVLVVCDEAYYEYADDPDFPDTLSLMKEYPNLVATRTFSKAYGMAALRVGYAVAAADLVSFIEPAREPFNVSRIAQKAAVKALEDQAFIERCTQLNRDGLKDYYEFCRKHGLEYYESQANFITIKLPFPGMQLFENLLIEGYIIRAGEALGLPETVRITIGSHEQNEGLMAALEKYLV